MSALRVIPLLADATANRLYLGVEAGHHGHAVVRDTLHEVQGIEGLDR